MLSRRHSSRALLVATLLGVTLADAASAAETGLDGASPTLFLDATFGFSTYKSKLVESNDTGTALSYSLGGYAGRERTLGFLIKTDTATTAFELNESSVTATWQDSVIRYRYGYAYAGAVFGRTEMKADKAGTETLDLAGSGIGGNAGFLVPIGKLGVFYLDFTTLTFSSTKDTLSKETAVGARQDIDLGGTFNLTREAFHLLVGYRQRSYSVTAGESFAESYLTTYLGLRAATYF